MEVSDIFGASSQPEFEVCAKVRSHIVSYVDDAAMPAYSKKPEDLIDNVILVISILVAFADLFSFQLNFKFGGIQVFLKFKGGQKRGQCTWAETQNSI